MLTGELKKILAKVPDDLKVVTLGFDHSYEKVFGANVAFAENYEDGFLGEYYEDEGMAEGSRKIEVFVIE